ncbi:hypothetical protein QOT17_001386 [Balamuthia mandrillaris]
MDMLNGVASGNDDCSTAGEIGPMTASKAAAMASIFPPIKSVKEAYQERRLYWERYVNEGTRTYSNISMYSELQPKYRNNSDAKSFPLLCYRVPREGVNVHLVDPCDAVKTDFLLDGGQYVKFCLHPQFENAGGEFNDVKPYERLEDEPVAPRSSSRTLFPFNKEYDIKVHCPVRLSRYNRGIGDKIARHYLETTRALANVNLPFFAYMAETLAVIFPAKEGKRSHGFVVRERDPLPRIAAKPRLLMPCFALYSKDKFHPEKRPLVMDLIEMSGMEPLDFILSKVFYPVIESWTHIFLTQAIVIEPHGQNLLLEIGTWRIVLRDFDIHVHEGLRKQLGLPLGEFHPGNLFGEPTEDRPFGSIPSLYYDKSVGKQFFDYLAPTMQEHYGIPVELLQEFSSVQNSFIAFPLDRFVGIGL